MTADQHGAGGFDRSLFEIDDLDAMPPVRDMTVSPVTTGDVHEFCRRYHYTQRGGSVSWRYGLWHNHTLLGVAAYNLPTRETCQSVFGPDHADKVWHMGRLALAPEAPRNSESRLIGGSLRWISRDFPDTWAVITYAATDAGHIGYVYQATNALYTGTGGHSAYYTDQLGGRHGDYLRGRQVTSERAAQLGWSRHEGGVKHRYLYLLGSRTQRRRRRQMLRLPTLPYPKIVQIQEAS